MNLILIFPKETDFYSNELGRFNPRLDRFCIKDVLNHPWKDLFEELIRKKIIPIYADFDLVEETLHNYAGSLSGGILRGTDSVRLLNPKEDYGLVDQICGNPLNPDAIANFSDTPSGHLLHAAGRIFASGKMKQFFDKHSALSHVKDVHIRGSKTGIWREVSFFKTNSKLENECFDTFFDCPKCGSEINRDHNLWLTSEIVEEICVDKLKTGHLSSVSSLICTPQFIDIINSEFSGGYNISPTIDRNTTIGEECHQILCAIRKLLDHRTQMTNIGK